MMKGYDLVSKLSRENNQEIQFEKHLDYMMERMSGTRYQAYLKILLSSNQKSEMVKKVVYKRISK